jgi:DNA (cytosine-5)-methyltransferase 1
MTLRVLDLFSGIGGFSLGLERTGGFQTVAFCEIEEFPRRVLAKHWPHVPCYDDVRTLTAERLRADGISVDVICGGFPCQDISIAQGASRAGLDGERSGLWREYARLIGELRPRYLIVENVPGLLSLGLGRVLGDLAAIRYDAEWHCIPAGVAGAPHIRDRFWLVGYPNDEGQPIGAVDDEAPRMPRLATDADCGDEYRRSRDVQVGWGALAGQIAADGFFRGTEWGSEPDVGRVAHGVPSRVDRLRGLGNAVVPQIPELIGRAILSSVREAA